MKRTVATMGAAALILSVSMQPAFAAARASYSQTRIYLDGQNITNPVHTTAIDPSTQQLTTFMPIYYAEQVLTQLGIASSWDGTTWSLTVPSSMNVNLDSPSNGASGMSISVNGTVVQTAPKVVAVDPASGQETTFIPVWYLGQVLNRMGLESSWDGTNWRLTRTTSVTKLQAAKDFMNTLGVSGDSSGSNPYDDVSSTDWPVIHRAIENGYFSSDSSTHFGATDSMSTGSVDHAYQLFLGIPDSHMGWNAGGTLAAWSNVVGLNSGVNTSYAMSTSDEEQMMGNIAHIQNGYYQDSNGTYHLMFHPYDAYVWSDPNYKVTQQLVSGTLATEISLINQVTFTENGSKMEFTTKGISDKANSSVTIGSRFNHGGNFTQYSLDGGKTWRQATGDFGYDSSDLANGGVAIPPSYVYVKANGHVEILPIVTDPSNGQIGFISLGITPNSVPTINYGSTSMAQ